MKPASEVAAGWDKKFSVPFTEVMHERICDNSEQIYVLLREICPILDMMISKDNEPNPSTIEIRQELAHMLRVINGTDWQVPEIGSNMEVFAKRFKQISLDLYQALQVLRDDNWEHYLKEGNSRDEILKLLDYVDDGKDYLSFVSQNERWYRQRAIADKLAHTLESMCKVYDGEMQPVIENTRRSFIDTLHLMELHLVIAKQYLAHIDGEEARS